MRPYPQNYDEALIILKEKAEQEMKKAQREPRRFVILTIVVTFALGLYGAIHNGHWSYLVTLVPAAALIIGITYPGMKREIEVREREITYLDKEEAMRVACQYVELCNRRESAKRDE